MLIQRGESGLLIPAPGILVARTMPATLEWLPTDISGLELWYRADEISGLEDNDEIGTWSDESGNGRDATGTLTGRPRYKTNIQNSKPGVRYDGSNDVLYITIALSSGPFTFVICYNPDVVEAAGKNLFDTQTGRMIICNLTNTEGKVGYYDGAFKAIADATADAQIMVWRLEAAGGELFRNGASIGTDTHTEKAIGGAVGLGNRYTSANSPFDGYMFEFLLYSSALSVGDRQSVESYLNERWAIY